MNIKNGTFLMILSALLVMPAFADGNAFTPLNFDDTAYSVPSTQNKTTTPATTTTKPAVSVSNASVNNSSTVNTSTAATKTVGNDDLQSAMSKIDAALQDINADQNLCKSKYADVDNQYKFIKNERSSLKSQIRQNNKRIRDLNKAKTRLGKNVL